MCPASTSTAMPSGSRHSVTMTLRSEPSGFSESTRLPLASRTNKRPIVARPTDACSDCEDLSCVMYCPFIVAALQARGVLHAQGRAIDRPTRSIELRFQPVSRQVRNGDHHEAVCFAQPDQVRHEGH